MSNPAGPPPSLAGTPERLRRRPLDLGLALLLLAQSAAGLLVDALPQLGLPVATVEAALHAHYGAADPMFMDPPAFFFVAILWSGFVSTPLCAWFALGLVRGSNKIRIPVLMWAPATALATAMVLAEEVLSTVPAWRSPAPLSVVGQSLSWLVVPLLVAWRVRQPFPFGGGLPEAERLLALALGED